MRSRTFFFISIFFCCLSGTTQDIANFERFKKDNDSIMMQSNIENKVVFMGNSITEGWLNKELDFFDNPAYINRGIGGQTTSQMLLRFQQDVIQLQPKVVVILAGINDIAQNMGPIAIEHIFDNIKSMCELADANDIKVVICSILPAKVLPWRLDIDPIQKVIHLNKLMLDYASSKGFVYVDYYNALVREDFGLPLALTSDEVHLTIEGYKALVPIVQDGIEAAFKQ